MSIPEKYLNWNEGHRLRLDTEEKRALRTLLTSKKHELDPEHVNKLIRTQNGDILRYLAEREDLTPTQWRMMARASQDASITTGSYSQRRALENELQDKILGNLGQRDLLALARDPDFKLSSETAQKLDATHLMELFDHERQPNIRVIENAIKNNPNFGREHLELAMQHPNTEVGYAAAHSQQFNAGDVQRAISSNNPKLRAVGYKRGMSDFRMQSPEFLNRALLDPSSDVTREIMKAFPHNEESENILKNHIHKPEVARELLERDQSWDRRRERQRDTGHEGTDLSDEDVSAIIRHHSNNKEVMRNVDADKHINSPENAKSILALHSQGKYEDNDILKSSLLSAEDLHGYLRDFDVNADRGYRGSDHVRKLGTLLDNPNLDKTHLDKILAHLDNISSAPRGGYPSYDDNYKQQVASEVRAKIFTHPAASEEAKASLDLTDSRLLYRLATSGNKLTDEMYQAIANSPDDRTREYLASYHGSKLPDAVLSQLAKDKSARVRYQVFKKALNKPLNEIPEDVIKTAIQDKSKKVREQVFKKDLPSNLLEWAMGSRHAGTRAAAVAHRNATPTMIERASSDKSQEVLRSVASHGRDLTPEQSSRIFINANPDLQQELLTWGHFRVPDNAIDLTIDSGNQRAMANLSLKDNLSEHQIRRLYEAGDDSVKRNVLKNESTPADLLEQAAYHPNPNVAERAAEHKNLSTETARKLFNSEDRDIRKAVVSRPDAGDEIWEKALSDEDWAVKKAVVANHSTPGNLLRTAWQMHSADPHIASYMLDNPNVPDDVLEAAINHQNHRIKDRAKEAVKLHKPDIYNRTLEGAHDIEINPLTEKLKHIKGLIEEAPNKSVHKKELEKRGFHNLPTQILDGKGNITPQSIDASVEALPKDRYNVSYGKWESMQRHSSAPQKVLQLNLTNEHVKALRDQGLWETFKKVHDMSYRSGHPVQKHTLGWARIDDSHPDHWHIDEIQSDIGRGTIQAIERAKAEGQMSEEDANKYKDHLKRMIKTLSGGHKNINHAIFSAVHAVGRKLGIKTTSMDQLPDQMRQSSQDQTREPPVHMKETYQEMPKQVGYTDADKKKAMPNTDAKEPTLQLRKLVKSLNRLRDMTSDLAYIDFLQKSEKIAELESVTDSRHKQMGKKKIDRNAHVRADTQTVLNYKLEKSQDADSESEQIKKNQQTPEAKNPHKFRPAKWTHPNGHPRCFLCGDEEPVGGVCDGFDEPLEKGARGDWKKEGYTLKYRKDIGGDHWVTAFSPEGKQVGIFRFMSGGEGDMHPLSSEVDKAHRRKGIASAAYDLAEKKAKLSMEPSVVQSTDAKKFWANRLGHTTKSLETFKKSVQEILEKAFYYKGSHFPEASDPEGMLHPGGKPYIKITSAKHGAVWAHKPEVAKKIENDFMHHYNRFTPKLSPKGQGLMAALGKKLSKDPDAHVIATGVGDNQEYRLRHMAWAMAGRPGYSITETPTGLNLTAERHPGRTDKSTESHTWHFDGKDLKFLGKMPISKSLGGDNEKELRKSDGRAEENSGKVPDSSGRRDGGGRGPGVDGQEKSKESVTWKDKIPGGKADKKKPGQFDKKQLEMGIKVELEHTNNPRLALEIAMDHLTEDPEYYTKLMTIEPEHMNKSSEINISCVAVVNGDKILMGKRRDNGKWTMPGGHVEAGESPDNAAHRELYEEAAIKADSLQKLGNEEIMCEDGKRRHIHAYLLTGRPKASTKLDPDGEVSQWYWVDCSNGLPKSIEENLHSKKNVALKLLGLQEWQ